MLILLRLFARPSVWSDYTSSLAIGNRQSHGELNYHRLVYNPLSLPSSVAELSTPRSGCIAYSHRLPCRHNDPQRSLEICLLVTSQ